MISLALYGTITLCVLALKTSKADSISIDHQKINDEEYCISIIELYRKRRAWIYKFQNLNVVLAILSLIFSVIFIIGRFKELSLIMMMQLVMSGIIIRVIHKSILKNSIDINTNVFMNYREKIKYYFSADDVKGEIKVLRKIESRKIRVL